MFFYRRRRSGPDGFLAVKLATFILGAVLGLVGMRIDKPFLVGVAIGVVLVGVLLRLVSQRSDAAVKDREQRVP